MKKNKEWLRYLELLKERPEEFSGNGLPIVIDEKTVAKFEEETGKTIGVIYESRWHYWIVDLVRNPDTGAVFAYERMVYVQSHGAVGILPFYKGKIVLIREYRHQMQGWQWSIPRGFGEPGISPEDNAIKELREETGAQAVKELTHLGKLVADSGQAGVKVDIFSAEVGGLFSLDKGEAEEKIDRIATFTEDEILAMVTRGEFDDGFTLAAITMWYASQQL